jgi:NAD(P)H-flavin reductase
MDITAHNSQHENAEALPLVSDSASVTEVKSLDHNRVEEILSSVSILLREEPDVDDSVVEDREGDEHPESGWLEPFEKSEGGNELDWDALRDLLEGVGDPIREKVEVLLERYERPYPGLLRIRIDEDLDFSPGQYVTMRYEQTPRPYSIVSSPNEEELELCLRRVPEGTLTTDLFEELSKGETVSLRGPNGDFLLEEPSDRDMIFLATGTGVAPLKSMIEYTFEEGYDSYDGEQRDLWLFLGSSWEDDLPYRERFSELDEQHDNFHFVPTLSRESYLSDWDGETDYVQYALMKYIDEECVTDTDLDENVAEYLAEEPAYDIEARLDPDSMEVYACGINAMVFPLVSTVSDLGVPEQHINSEGYG